MTNNETNSEIALEILIDSRAEVAPSLPEKLLRACYFIQKNNQFTSDRSLPMAEMEKLIDAEVDKLSSDAGARE